MIRDSVEKLRDDIEALRRKALADVPDEGLGPFSREHYRLALASLDAARAHAELAAMWFGRGD